MVDGCVSLECEELRDVNRSRRTDPRQIVAQQVDDHEILGPIFLALGERQAERRIVLGAEAPRAGAFDGPRLDEAPGIHAKKSFRRRAEHHGIRQIEKCCERRRISRTAHDDW